MPICVICDDTGLQNSDPADPEFCYCSAGKQARRQWEANASGKGRSGKEGSGRYQPGSGSFIDIAKLDEVNASVDAMRATLLGSLTNETGATTRHAAVQLLYQVAHANHEVSVVEATQLYELAKAIEGFLAALAPIGRNSK